VMEVNVREGKLRFGQLSHKPYSPTKRKNQKQRSGVGDSKKLLMMQDKSDEKEGIVVEWFDGMIVSGLDISKEMYLMVSLYDRGDKVTIMNPPSNLITSSPSSNQFKILNENNNNSSTSLHLLPFYKSLSTFNISTTINPNVSINYFTSWEYMKSILLLGESELMELVVNNSSSSLDSSSSNLTSVCSLFLPQVLGFMIQSLTSTLSTHLITHQSTSSFDHPQYSMNKRMGIDIHSTYINIFPTLCSLIHLCSLNIQSSSSQQNNDQKNDDDQNQNDDQDDEYWMIQSFQQEIASPHQYIIRQKPSIKNSSSSILYSGIGKVPHSEVIVIGMKNGREWCWEERWYDNNPDIDHPPSNNSSDPKPVQTTVPSSICEVRGLVDLTGNQFQGVYKDVASGIEGIVLASKLTSSYPSSFDSSRSMFSSQNMENLKYQLSITLSHLISLISSSFISPHLCPEPPISIKSLVSYYTALLSNHHSFLRNIKDEDEDDEEEDWLEEKGDEDGDERFYDAQMENEMDDDTKEKEDDGVYDTKEDEIDQLEKVSGGHDIESEVKKEIDVFVRKWIDSPIFSGYLKHHSFHQLVDGHLFQRLNFSISETTTNEEDGNFLTPLKSDELIDWKNQLKYNLIPHLIDIPTDQNQEENKKNDTKSSLKIIQFQISDLLSSSKTKEEEDDNLMIKLDKWIMNYVGKSLLVKLSKERGDITRRGIVSTLLLHSGIPPSIITSAIQLMEKDEKEDEGENDPSPPSILISLWRKAQSTLEHHLRMRDINSSSSSSLSSSSKTSTSPKRQKKRSVEEICDVLDERLRWFLYDLNPSFISNQIRERDISHIVSSLQSSH